MYRPRASPIPPAVPSPPQQLPAPRSVARRRISKKYFPAFPRKFAHSNGSAARAAHIPRNRAGNTEGPRHDDDDVHETDDDDDDHDRALVGCWTLDVEHWMLSIMFHVFHVSCFLLPPDLFRHEKDPEWTRFGRGFLSTSCTAIPASAGTGDTYA